MKYLSIPVLMVAFLGPQFVYATPSEGKALHDEACQACHDNGIYTRNNSIIGSMSDLKERVKFCEKASRQHWNEAQHQAVVEYLNKEFYKFPANQAN